MKKMRNIKVFMVLSIIAMIAFAGCTAKNEQTSNTPQGDVKISGEEGNGNTNQGINTGNEKTTTQDSPVVQQTPKIVEPVNFSKLIELLPNSLAGWSSGKPVGRLGEERGHPSSSASIEFTKGESRAIVGIQDTGNDYGGSPPQGNLGDNMGTIDSDMYSINMKVKGFPALEMRGGGGQYDKMILIKGRFLVHITVIKADKDVLNTLENSINLNSIADLV